MPFASTIAEIVPCWGAWETISPTVKKACSQVSSSSAAMSRAARPQTSDEKSRFGSSEWFMNRASSASRMTIVGSHGFA